MDDNLNKLVTHMCYITLVKFYKYEILKVFTGKRPQDIYAAIFKYEKENNVEWFKNKQHIAYLGKELKKAEIALALGNTGYYQE